MPGYNERLSVVDKVREDYLRERSKVSRANMYNVHSVPLDHINGELQAANVPWRVSIFDDQFEFFTP